MRHYFTNDDSPGNRELKYIDYNFRGHDFKFATHSGVFSKDHVDSATDILLNTVADRLTVNCQLSTVNCLDLGCGYGVIGIVLAKVYELQLTSCDINESALELARLNCQLSTVNCQLFKSDCFGGVSGKFDVITLNPPIHAGKSVTYRMYEESPRYLAEGGRLYIVTLKKHGVESTLAKLREVFGKVEVIYKKKGIYVIESMS
ncbi:MAG: methyltransferase [Oscillospiraceae bacterium]|nr:methyltransferase [Oscillospiraceae bacterium]